MLRKEQHIQNKKKIEQKDEESLNLFNKIEAMKNQRLNIDENSESEENKEEDPNIKKEKVIPIQKEQSVENTQKNQDSSAKDRSKPIIMDPQYENKDLSESRKPYEYDMKDTKSTQSAQSNQSTKSNNEILLKLVGISSDWTVIKINIIFSNPSNPLEVTFDFDLRRDTSEGVVQELVQAFPVKPNERSQIKTDIDKIVSKALEKFWIPSNQNNGSMVPESKTPKSEGYTSSQIKPQPDEINDSIPSEYAKNVEKAQYLIHNFITNIYQEIRTIQRNQSVLEEINPSAESEATNLSLQFINSIIDSYNTYQYQLSKWRTVPKMKGTKSTIGQPNSINKGKSFKEQNVSGQSPKPVEFSASRSTNFGISPDMHGKSQQAAFYMNQKDFNEEPQ